jgi:hypothetical protein
VLGGDPVPLGDHVGAIGGERGQPGLSRGDRVAAGRHRRGDRIGVHLPQGRLVDGRREEVRQVG